jgi:hypothetical protein
MFAKRTGLNHIKHTKDPRQFNWPIAPFASKSDRTPPLAEVQSERRSQVEDQDLSRAGVRAERARLKFEGDTWRFDG